MGVSGDTNDNRANDNSTNGSGKNGSGREWVLVGRGAWTTAALASVLALVAACTPGSPALTDGATGPAATSAASATPHGGHSVSSRPSTTKVKPLPGSTTLPGMPPVLDPNNIYSADGPGMLSPATAGARSLVYVPDGISNRVDVIDPATYKVIDHFAVGRLPQHVVPSYDLKTLWVTNDLSNTLTAIDPKTGKKGRTVSVDDPYNMYFSPDGKYAMVMAEARQRIDFLDPQTMAVRHKLVVSCQGVDHGDFTADGRLFVASCEFVGKMVVVDVARQKVLGYIDLGNRHFMPQDVKLSPDGRVFYVADMMANGVWIIDAKTLTVIGRIATGRGAHGLYVSRDSKTMYVANRDDGSVSLIDLATRKVRTRWQIPPTAGGLNASPDMGNLSADGKVLWLSGRYRSEVYAIDTTSGRLLARIKVGVGPHGLCVWPQPGRYSIGHTGILR
jgi:YVTN family beta-propeller protein